MKISCYDLYKLDSPGTEFLTCRPSDSHWRRYSRERDGDIDNHDIGTCDLDICPVCDEWYAEQLMDWQVMHNIKKD